MAKEWSALLISLVLLTACQKKSAEPAAAPATPLRSMEMKVAKFVPVPLKWDPALLSAGDKQALRLLIQAADVLGEVYALQTNPQMLEWLQALPEGTGKQFFLLNGGPWDRLNSNAPLPGFGARPLGGGLYPPDMAKDELEKAVAARPEEREAFTNYFTVITREGGALKPVPYAKFFHDRLARAADLLKQAAAATPNETLRKFLNSRAEAFLSNDYLQSDMDWMDIRGAALETTIGPYETYEDELFNYKAFFEVFLSIVDPVESAKLEFVQKELPDLDKSLPYPKGFNGPPKGLESPIQVVNLVYNAGEARPGIQTTAYNLPNDERVVAKKGSKKVLLKNVIEAKYEAILKPIAKTLLAEEMLPFVNPDAFFNETLFHEVSHGLGPGILILKDGTQTTVRDQFKDLYPGFEEAKADVGGLHCIAFLAKKNMFPRQFKEQVAATYLASMFRSLRFGTTDAHAKGMMMQFNWLLEKGAINRTAGGVWQSDPPRFYEAMEALLERFIALQAEGSYDSAKAFLAHYGNTPPHLESDLARLKDLPVDIAPQFQLDF